MTIPTQQGRPLELPETGVGSVAPFGRRLLALLVDWILCQLIATALFGMQWGQVGGTEAFYPLLLLLVENTVLVGTLGTTVGHRLLGVRVVDVHAASVAAGTPPTIGRSLVRAVLLCLFVPALIMDSHGRGLHDRAARTVVVRGR
ncbi:RDD family protein [Ornithinimicrobium avium]|uniref:RDD family protein n=1 Tax=Ornithinimicrobium avium TaxID=2283195 RepID=A0A345NKR3_9MICO|nr:RDD family protein [Ornithinimicrobium avium]AXH95621.1 RDD family protein [Ornithinimicrobium avium]